jgi:hypothetical protein
MFLSRRLVCLCIGICTSACPGEKVASPPPAVPLTPLSLDNGTVKFPLAVLSPSGLFHEGAQGVDLLGQLHIELTGSPGVTYSVGTESVKLNASGKGEAIIDVSPWLNGLRAQVCPVAKLKSSTYRPGDCPYPQGDGTPIKVAIAGPGTNGTLELREGDSSHLLGEMAALVAEGRAVAPAPPGATGLVYSGAVALYGRGPIAHVGDVQWLAVDRTVKSAEAGQCGPYYAEGSNQPEYVPRYRVDRAVYIFDRSGKKVAEKVFPGKVPTCALIRFGPTGEESEFDVNAVRSYLTSVSLGAN